MILAIALLNAYRLHAQCIGYYVIRHSRRRMHLRQVITLLLGGSELSRFFVRWRHPWCKLLGHKRGTTALHAGTTLPAPRGKDPLGDFYAPKSPPLPTPCARVLGSTQLGLDFPKFQSKYRNKTNARRFVFRHSIPTGRYILSLLISNTHTHSCIRPKTPPSIYPSCEGVRENSIGTRFSKVPE